MTLSPSLAIRRLAEGVAAAAVAEGEAGFCFVNLAELRPGERIKATFEHPASRYRYPAGDA